MERVQSKKAPKKRHSITNEFRRSMYGRLFVLPWLIGAIIFFIIPFIQTSVYTFSNMIVNGAGMKLSFVGLDNYIRVFTDNKDFKENLLASSNLLIQIPVILAFSLFVAMVLKNKFFGRTVARTVFFLPVIIASGVIIGILKESVFNSSGTGDISQQTAYMFQAPDFTILLSNLGIPGVIVDNMKTIINQIFDLCWKSGVQTLLLLAAINNIPNSSYEAADIEGATEWEKFWKITFWMITPVLYVAVIYTIIDSFTDYSNKMMRYISTLFTKGNYCYGDTVSFIYFIIVLICIGLFSLIVSKHVFYMSE